MKTTRDPIKQLNPNPGCFLCLSNARFVVASKWDEIEVYKYCCGKRDCEERIEKITRDQVRRLLVYERMKRFYRNRASKNLMAK